MMNTRRIRFLLCAFFLCIACGLSAQQFSSLSVVHTGGDCTPAFSEKETLWEITSSSSDFSPEDTVNQKVVSRSISGGKTAVRILSGDFSRAVSLSDEQRKEFLSATRFIHPSEPAVCRFAEKIRTAD
ncbi:MAG: hypothetical protein ACRCUT_00705, partial [Spirochaetota bacterium]